MRALSKGPQPPFSGFTSRTKSHRRALVLHLHMHARSHPGGRISHSKNPGRYQLLVLRRARRPPIYRGPQPLAPGCARPPGPDHGPDPARARPLRPAAHAYHGLTPLPHSRAMALATAVARSYSRVRALHIALSTCVASTLQEDEKRQLFAVPRAVPISGGRLKL